jgi:hypothetical protein
MAHKKSAPRKRNSTKPTKSVSMKDQEQTVLDIGGTMEEQPGPATVVNGRMLAEYVKPHFSRDRNDDRFIALEFSTKLTEAHTTVLPKSVLAAWDYLRSENGNNPDAVMGVKIVPQTVRIFLTSDTRDEELMIVGGIVSHAKVQIVEERGSGEAVKYTRFSFRVENERSKNIVNFAAWSDGKQVWLDSKATQPGLL